MFVLWTFGLLGMLGGRVAGGEAIQIMGGPGRVNLLELYTSEGCAGCPPADAWMSRLKDKAGLWKGFVPVVFHVDSWDELGWVDRFGNKAYSERQRLLAARWGRRSLMTPGFVLNGEEWRGWFRRGEVPGASGGNPGILLARSKDAATWTLRFQPSTNTLSGPFNLHAALLGFDFRSDVKAGENKGITLLHDFVVLSAGKVSGMRVGDAFEGSVTLKAGVGEAPKRLGVAAWVSLSKDEVPIQAAGGWLPAAAAKP